MTVLLQYIEQRQYLHNNLAALGNFFAKERAATHYHLDGLL